MMLPIVMEYNQECTGEKYREIARAMGVKGVDDMTLEELSEALKTEIVIVDTGGRDLVEAVINPPKHKPTRRRQIYEQTSSSDSGKA